MRSGLVRELLERAKEAGDSVGGEVEIWVEGCPLGLGQPVFHKLKGDLASAYMGVGACVGVEIGDGFSSAKEMGSDYHEEFSSPRYGGIRGGISTGERIVVRVAIKPTSSIGNTAKKGRHDPCIVTRVIPVLEAMTWLVLADHALWMRNDRIEEVG
jgi:chorismate synthase